MGRASQRRGRRAEIELANILRGNGFPNAAPGPPMSFGSAPDLAGVEGCHVEVKNVQNLNLVAALNQAAEDSAYFGDGLPAVFHRHKGGRWVVSMSLQDWLTLYQGGGDAG